MTLEEPIGVEEVLKRGISHTQKLIWLDPHGGKTIQEALGSGAAGAGGSMRGTGEVIALVGPEGGWSDRERKTLEAAVAAGQVAPVRLTETILRIETACAAIAAIVMGGGGR